MERSNRLHQFHKLRGNYPIFIYESFSYTIKDSSVSFQFVFKLTDEIVFKPSASIILPYKPAELDKVLPLMENLIFNIGMIELISYWKSTCSPTIIVKAGSLTEDQKEWWKNLYFHGLGEFFYLNSIEIDQEDFVNIRTEGREFFKSQPLNFTNDYIVPIGGGKDSAVTLELLIKSGYKVQPLIINPRGATIETVHAANLPKDETIYINRSIDSCLLELNEQGFLNGHTPFSAMLAFYTLLASALTGKRNIALSNESSANEATIPGTHINHQYSKSIHFESNFRYYYNEYISNDFNYFSFLRPLNELQISSIFSKLDKYHKVFRSCNAGSKNNTWCGSCPKCLFTYIMLAAHTSTDYATEIIGFAMLNDNSNVLYFDELCGFSLMKPFECVGTVDDVQKAMQMIVQKYQVEELPLLVRRFVMLFEPSVNQPFETSEDIHFLNDQQLNILKQAL